jgi:hypothetical protein
MKRRLVLITCVAVVSGVLDPHPRAADPKFYDDDPVWTEPETQDASAIRKWEIDLAVDLASSLFMAPGDKTPNVRAQSINTVDEVPDSSWFTNRLGRTTLTARQVAIGPDTSSGPPEGTWTVISSKNDGVTPGFIIRDAGGQIWFLKFDPPGYRAMATGTEVLATKLFWALGYHVPENYIASLHPDRLTISDQAKFTTAGGVDRKMEPADISTMLKRVDRDADGSYRVIASQALPKVGEFRFYGTHPDDPNDIIPHEHRRELRGYGVFAAWLNHVDAKGKNTLDALIKEGGRARVRHYLQDFGSTLGSASVTPREYWEGNETLLEGGEVAKQMLGFGFAIPAWRRMEFYEAPSIGRLPRDNTKFNPELWRPRVPNPAFVRSRADDKFWAARILSFMTNDMLRAAVEAGRFGDPASEKFLVEALADRRDAIVRTYLPAANPLYDAALSREGQLTLKNAAVDAGVAKAPGGYRAVWAAFDNVNRTADPLGETRSAELRLQAPAAVAQATGFIRVAVEAENGPPAWQKPVHIYFRRADAGGEWRLVGFERMPE